MLPREFVVIDATDPVLALRRAVLSRAWRVIELLPEPEPPPVDALWFLSDTPVNTLLGEDESNG